MPFHPRVIPPPRMTKMPSSPSTVPSSFCCAVSVMTCSVECANDIASAITVRLKPGTTAVASSRGGRSRASGARNHRRDLDFDFRAVLDQCPHFDGAHRGPIHADDLTERGTNLLATSEVLALVGQIP